MNIGHLCNERQTSGATRTLRPYLPTPLPTPPTCRGGSPAGASDAVTWRVRTAPPPQPGRLVASHSGALRRGGERAGGGEEL